MPEEKTLNSKLINGARKGFDVFTEYMLVCHHGARHKISCCLLKNFLHPTQHCSSSSSTTVLPLNVGVCATELGAGNRLNIVNLCGTMDA